MAKLTIHQALEKALKAHKSGKLQDAYRILETILKYEPQHPDGNHNMGVLLVSMSKHDEALFFFEKALKSNPNVAQFWYSCVDLLIKLQRLSDATTLLTQAKNKGAAGDAFEKLEQVLLSQSIKERIQVGVQRVNDLCEQGEFTAAIDTSVEFSKVFPDSEIFYFLIGLSNFGLGSLDIAIENYTQALKINPDFVEAHNNIGNVLRQKDELQAAMKSYARAIKINPNFAEAHHNIANILKENGDLEGAISSYKLALKIKPEYAEAYCSMGVALQETGDLDAALESIKRSIDINPRYADAHYNLGTLLMDKNDPKASLDSYRQTLKIDPDYTSAWHNLFLPLQILLADGLPQEEFSSLAPEDGGSKFAQTQKAILKYRLFLGTADAESTLLEALDLLPLTKDRTIKNPEVKKHKTSPGLAVPEKTIALVHFGRSGTGLLHSLIDGHPEVSTMPSIYFSDYFDHSIWKEIIAGGWGQMADRFIASYDILFDASSLKPIMIKSKKVYGIGKKEGLENVGPRRDEILTVDKILFRAELKRLMAYCEELDALSFFHLVQAAYNKAIGDINDKNLLFYHIHNPNAYAKLNFITYAPSASWVMMVREPIQCCESWMRAKFNDNDYASCSGRILIMLSEIDNIIYHRQNSIGVRLEDLKEHPRKTIPALCKWMGIDETESLYEMTTQGKKWWGDPDSPDFAKEGMDPFGKSAINRKVGSVFSQTDQFILRTLFYPFNVRFGYQEENIDQFKLDLQLIKPMFDDMFDFEKTIVEQTGVNPKIFVKSTSYLYLRSGLIKRWEVLNKYYTYPNMINPLEINWF